MKDIDTIVTSQYISDLLIKNKYTKCLNLLINKYIDIDEKYLCT